VSVVRVFLKNWQKSTGDTKMKIFATYTVWAVLVGACGLAGCASGPVKSADVSDSVRKSLDLAGLKGVTVKQDRVKGVVTLGGQVATEGEKAQAELLATPIAAGQVVAVEIAVIPVGAEKDARAINTALDEGIGKNLEAALIQNRMQKLVKYEVNNAVVTLSGEVESDVRRTAAEQVAASVPYVKQVVNTLQIKNQKATTTL
jgi:hyperosmotically inducible protein